MYNDNTTAVKSNAYNAEYCTYRLPCGICTRTNAMCPLQNNWHISWSDGPTCTSEIRSEFHGTV